MVYNFISFCYEMNEYGLYEFAWFIGKLNDCELKLINNFSNPFNSSNSIIIQKSA